MTNPLPGYGDGIPDELVLGYITWWTISNPKLTHPQLSTLVDKHGLSKFVLPPPPRPGDAFKRACRYSERTGIPIPYSDHVANVLIRPVSQTTDEIERHLVIEVKDSQGKRLEYFVPAQMRFSRVTNDCHVRRLTSQNPELDGIVTTALATFSANLQEAAEVIDAQAIRRMIRDQLAIMRAISVRRQGSVYFYPAKAKATGEALERFCAELGDGSSFHTLPLVDTSKQREMVRAAFEDEVHEQANQILVELARAEQEGRQLTVRQYEEYLSEFRTLQNSLGEYQSLVSHELSKADVELEVVNARLLGFITDGKVKVEKKK